METLVIAIFVLGYLAITLEHNLKIDKLIPALGMLAVLVAWSILVVERSARWLAAGLVIDTVLPPLPVPTLAQLTQEAPSPLQTLSLAGLAFLFASSLVRRGMDGFVGEITGGLGLSHAHSHEHTHGPGHGHHHEHTPSR